MQLFEIYSYVTTVSHPYPSPPGVADYGVSELSKDMVDSLQKKAEARNKKLEGLRSAQRPGWEIEVNKMVEGERDNRPIFQVLIKTPSYRRGQRNHQLPAGEESLYSSLHVARVFLGLAFAPGGTGDLRMEGVHEGGDGGA